MLSIIGPPVFTAALREDQALVDCCDDSNPMFSGKHRHTFGFNVISTVRVPCRIVNGRRVYFVAAVDHRKIGAPSELLYMEWQIIGHDAILFGEMIWDTFVFSGRGIVVAAVYYE